MLSRIKHPIEYELSPTEIGKGKQWLTLKLKNIGRQSLRRLSVELHSLDTFYLFPLIFPYAFGEFIGKLKPGEQREVAFPVNATASADVYATIKAYKEGDYFWWESGWTHISVTEEKAEIGRLVVLSNPYTKIGETLSVEATIKGLQKSTGLNLEFWVETPAGKSEEQATIAIKDLPVGEEARYTAEFTPKETGYYTIYAYLYDGWRRIGHKTDNIYAKKA
jgi:hypothetical protein